jgi:hypothetical protein
MEITEYAIHMLAEVERSVQDHYCGFADGQHYLLDRFFTKLLKLQEAMTTTTGRAMAARRIAFLRLYLQELLHELAIGGSGYDLSEEVTYHLLWGKRGEEQKKERPGEDLQRGRVVELPCLSEEQHSA